VTASIGFPFDAETLSLGDIDLVGRLEMVTTTYATAMNVILGGRQSSGASDRRNLPARRPSRTLNPSMMRDQRDVYVPDMNPAEIAGPSREVYGQMGRENIYRLIEDFYRELESSSIRGMFPRDLARASRKSAAFFVQLLGGPQEYSDRFGPPRMRARHMPFRITARARDEWLACFERVLERAVADHGFPEQHLPGFREFLRAFSMWMVNSTDQLSAP
jgi:hemoglobin